MEEASRRSGTFRRLVDRLNRPDLIVYVESGRCGHALVLSCVSISAAPRRIRYLRVTIDTNHSLQLIESQIAHELQHAAEIADAPEVVDGATLRELYGRIGQAGAGRDVFETAAAIDVATQVSHELGVDPKMPGRASAAALK